MTLSSPWRGREPAVEEVTDMTQVDVAIVGGGLSGLTAAWELVRQGHDVEVLEAQDRVGGRTFNRTIAGVTVDGGAAYVGIRQTALLSLAEQLGVDIFSVPTRGEPVLVVEGERVEGGAADLPEEDARQYDALLAALEELIASVDIEEPWKTPDARHLDSLSVDAWAAERGITSRPAIRVLSMTLITVLGSVASRISALWAGWYFAQGGGYAFLTNPHGGAQEAKFVGGSQSVSLRLAEELGDRVSLESPVRRIITGDDGGATLDLGDRQVHAQRVIVACSPSEAAKITFEPGLPEARQKLNEGWLLEGTHKPFLAYERAFWRDQGLSGEISSDGAMGVVMDASPASGRPGLLLAFTDEAKMPNSPEGRRDGIAADLATVLGDEALNVIDYVETGWRENPWISGCVSPLPPGFLVDLWPTMNDPVGPIHWAGTETARRSAGYMDGAVRAGQRAAGEVAAQLTAVPVS